MSSTRRVVIFSAILALIAGLLQAVAGPVSPASAAPLPAGEQWESQSATGDNAWFGVTWGAGKFVAIAGNGATKRAMTSPDGKTWTEATGNVPVAEWIGITYGNGKFVAVAKTTTGSSVQKVMTSTDGNNWEFQDAASDNQWLAVAYGSGTFVAVAGTGNQDRVMTSTDGENWTTRATHANSEVQWNGVTYGSNRFVAVSSTGKAVVSGDQSGTIWSNAPVSLGSVENSWLSVAYGDNKYVAVSISGTNRIATSPSGSIWTTQAAPEQNQWWSVTYGGNEGDKKFVAVAIDGANPIMTSSNGTDWEAHAAPAGTSGNQWRSVAWGATPGSDTLVAISRNGTNRVMTSPLISPEIGDVEITGDPEVGSELSVDIGAITGSNPLTVSHWWQRSDNGTDGWTDIGVENDDTYTVDADDRNKYIRVRVTASNEADEVHKNSNVVAIQSAPVIDDLEIQGETKVGATLEAVADITGTPDPDVGYQWQRSEDGGSTWDPIDSATDSTYELTADDLNKHVRVKVTASNGLGTDAVESPARGPIGQEPHIEPLEVTGLPKVGGSLTVAPVVAGSPSPTVSYEWQRSNNAGGPFTKIPFADSAIYSPVLADLDKYVRVEVKAENSYGLSTQYSTPKLIQTPPTVTSVGLTGETKIGATLTADVSETGTAPITKSYQWQRADEADADEGDWENIGGPTSDNTYTLGEDDLEQYVRVVVTASNEAGSNTLASEPSEQIGSAPRIDWVDIAFDGDHAKVNEELIAVPVGVGGKPDASYTYVWERSDAATGESWTVVANGTTPGFTPSDEDAGKYIRVTVTATNEHGSVEKVSDSVQINQAPSITSVTVTGTEMFGNTLTADVDADGFPAIEPDDISYQWQVAETVMGPWPDIAGATGKTYVLGQDEVGKLLRVKVTVNNGVPPIAEEYSAETGQIGQLPSVGSVTVTGSGVAGETLKAEWYDPAGFPFPDFAYKWQRSDNGTSGWAYISDDEDDGDEYVLTGDDEGKFVRAVVIATNDHGLSQTESSPVRVDVLPTIGGVAVTGTARVGSELTATGQDVVGGPDATMEFQWERSSNGVDSWVAISGATAAKYKLVTADQGKFVRAVATVINTAGSASAESAASARVAAAPAPAKPKIVKPNKPSSLKVKGKRTAKVFKATWKKPAGTNATTRPVVRYRVEVWVKGKKKALTAKNLNARTFSYKLKKNALRKLIRKNKVKNAKRYRFTVRVYAQNGAGRSMVAKAFIMNR